MTSRHVNDVHPQGNSTSRSPETSAWSPENRGSSKRLRSQWWTPARSSVQKRKPTQTNTLLPLSYLLVLQLDAHHPEGVVGGVVVDVDAAEALLAGLDGDPLLAGVVVHHDGGPGLADALLTGRRGGERDTGLEQWFSNGGTRTPRGTLKYCRGYS